MERRLTLGRRRWLTASCAEVLKGGLLAPIDERAPFSSDAAPVSERVSPFSQGDDTVTYYRRGVEVEG